MNICFLGTSVYVYMHTFQSFLPVTKCFL
jgi:hypothetical protein